jgi:hypothetical protein
MATPRPPARVTAAFGEMTFARAAVDLAPRRMRMAGMRRVLLTLVLVTIAVPVGGSAGGGDRGGRGVLVPGRLSIRVPAGWQVLHGWLSDVTDPAPRLAVASFPARLSRRTCACGFPNVIQFPRDGAFV